LATDIGRKFDEFGDFNIYKDSQNSCYIEFYYFDKERLPSGNIGEFIKIVQEKPEDYGVTIIAPYEEAVKFKAHDRLIE
jgi:hypothetical protein